MQSTGQTSTQDRSLTLIQGSAMMYDILLPSAYRVVVRPRMPNLDKRLGQSREAQIPPALRFRYPWVSWILVGIIHQRRRAETRTLLVGAGLQLFAEQGFELVTL